MKEMYNNWYLSSGAPMIQKSNKKWRILFKISYASNKESFKSRCTGMFRNYEAQDFGMLDKSEMIKEFDKWINQKLFFIIFLSKSYFLI